MKISLMIDLNIIKHYYALILHYDYDFLLVKPFRLTVSLTNEDFILSDAIFFSAEEAKQYFFNHYGKQALQEESNFLSRRRIKSKRIFWTHFFNSDGDLVDYAKEILKYPRIKALFDKYKISEKSINLFESVKDLMDHAKPDEKVSHEEHPCYLDLSWLKFS